MHNLEKTLIKIIKSYCGFMLRRQPLPFGFKIHKMKKETE